MLNADGRSGVKRGTSQGWHAEARADYPASLRVKRSNPCCRKKKKHGLLRCFAPRMTRLGQRNLSHPVLQHKARPARLADAVAEVVGLASRVGAEAHLIEHCRAAAAQARGENGWIAVADHARKP